MSLFTINSTSPIAIAARCTYDPDNARHGAWYTYNVRLHDGGAMMAIAERATADVMDTNRESSNVREFVEQLKKVLYVPGYEDRLDIGIEDISTPEHDIDMLRIGSTYFLEKSVGDYAVVECVVTFGWRV